MEFPIYRIEFDLNIIDQKEPIQCRQEMMLQTKFANGDEALASLRRMARSLADVLGVEDLVESWEGSIVFARMDTWCSHWNSHYCYRRFPTPADALSSFVEYKRRHPEEVSTPPEDWHICPCETCKALGRTVVLHWHFLGVDECKTCFSVSL